MPRVLIITVVGLLLGATAAAQRPGAILRGKKAAPKNNPAQVKKQLERLNRMTPSERQRFLENLPPERRAAAERRLEQYERLTPKQRDQLGRNYEELQNLSPARRNQVRRLARQFNEIPEERKPMVRQELSELRQMNEDDRRARINSDEFRNKFTAPERQILGELSQALEPEP